MVDNKIGALIVTFNRIEKLKKCLESYDRQTVKPNVILVVDNCSTDGTVKYLKAWREKPSSYKKEIVFLDSNIGGSGGFFEGMKAALESGIDWLWVADDDAYPDMDAFNILNKEISKGTWDVICSSVITKEGIDVGHRKVIDGTNYTTFGTPAPIELYDNDRFPISVFSFVGSCLKMDVIRDCGLPERDYFIWFDDTEYSLRVNKKYRICCIPSIKVFHDTIIEKEWRYSWKTYYGERNKLFTLKKHMDEKRFSKYLQHYKLGMVKHFFNDYDYFISQIDGYRDFKNGITGISENHKPGSKPDLKHH